MLMSMEIGTEPLSTPIYPPSVTNIDEFYINYKCMKVDLVTIYHVLHITGKPFLADLDMFGNAKSPHPYVILLIIKYFFMFLN